LRYVSGVQVTGTPWGSLSERALAALRAGIHFGFTPGVHLPVADEPQQFAASLCELAAELPVTRCTLTIDCRVVDTATAIAALQAARWRGRVFLLINPELSGQAAAHHEWGWQSFAANGQLATLATPALCAGVRSCCPLLAAEGSSTVGNHFGMTVPAGSAWVPLVVDLARFLRKDATIDRQRLQRTLELCVRHGDALHDHLAWHGSALKFDARLNRRLAIFVTGIGDVAAAAFSDPSSLSCLRALDELLGWIHTCLWDASRALAGERGALPALVEKQPSRRWRDRSHRQDWDRRWRLAVARVQVRNRNLLLLSPYSILPRRSRATPDYADLMPLLAHADVVGGAGPPWLWQWQASDLKHFYERMRAEIVRLNATSFIAAGA